MRNVIKLKLCCLWLAAFLCLAVLPCAGATAPNDSTSRKPTHYLGLDFRPAYTFPTHSFLDGQNAAQKPIRTNLSGHLKYGFRFSPDSYFGKVYPHAIQGIGVSYNTFFNSSELGNPLAVYVFQTSQIAAFSPRLSLDYEWNFGVSWGWKKYDATDNPMNSIVGSRINAYINLGLLLCWQLDSRTSLRAGIGVTHFSNGNTNYPNGGVNTLEGSIGIIRRFGSGQRREEAAPSSVSIPRAVSFKPYFSYDLIFYGATRRKGIFPEDSSPVLVPGSFAIAGFNFTPMYNFSPCFRAGLSLDAQYDESANIGAHIANTQETPDAANIRFHRPPFIEQFAVGLSARAEIVMPIFSINFGIGRNLLCRGVDTNSFYQILALKTDLTRRLFLHVGYQLYKFKDPNNLMLGLGFRFGGR
ncbi:acyloxyacyl hydrolase [Bacteroides sp. ET71]|uniref:acyloxyacyl hydrolase n=1 Tax=Bacteroides sp. ET71 TaxID=2939421 RepID=UPI0020137842|nr:acyloxyacyl hydrolase [Bacteroides sp. ET71]MCL1615569.1 acyloxyacyl hydrolase [Bacteroides sp. ET71]